MLELIHLEPEGVGVVGVLIGTEHFCVHGELIGLLHVEGLRNVTGLAVIFRTLLHIGGELNGLTCIGFGFAGCETTNLRQTTSFFGSHEDKRAVHQRLAVGDNLHVVTARGRQGGGHRERIGGSSNLLARQRIVDVEVASGVVGVFETDGEGFVGLDDALVHGEGFNHGERCFDILGPDDGTCGNAVLTNGAYTNLNLRVGGVERSVHHVGRPRGGGRHEGFFATVLDVDFVVPGAHFFVIDRAAGIFGLAIRRCGHREYHLEVGAVVIAAHHIGIGDGRSLGLLVEGGRHEGKFAEEHLVVGGRFGGRKTYASDFAAGNQAQFARLNRSGIPYAGSLSIGQGHIGEVALAALLGYHQAEVALGTGVHLIDYAEVVVAALHIPLRGEEAHVGAGRLAMEFQAGAVVPSIVVGEVGLECLRGHSPTIAIVHPPAPSGQEVLRTEVVPLVAPGGLTSLVDEAAVTKAEAGHERQFAERGALTGALGITVPSGQIGEFGGSIARIDGGQLENIAVGTREEEFLLLLVLVHHGIVALAALGGAGIELCAVVGTPNGHTDGVFHEDIPACVAILTEAAALHIETCIHVEGVATMALGGGDTVLQTILAPVVVEEEHVGDGLVEVGIVEPLIVVARQLTAVVAERTRIADISVPVHVEGPVDGLSLLVAGGEEELEAVVQLYAPRAFGIEGEARDAIVFHELHEFLGVLKFTGSTLLGQSMEGQAWLVHCIHTRTPVNEVGATRAHTVLVGYVIEGTRHAPPAVTPVGVRIDVLPHVEVVAIEIVARQGAPLLGHLADGRAPTDVLVVGIVEVTVGPNARQKAVLDGHAGDEEVFILIAFALTKGFAGLPGIQCSHNVARNGVLHIHFVCGHSLSESICSHQHTC